MADLLSLTGDVVGLGDSDVEDFNSFAPDTPHVMLQLADGRSLMVLGITRGEARKLGVGFSEPLTLSLSTAALASPPVAVQEEGDAKRLDWLAARGAGGTIRMDGVGDLIGLCPVYLHWGGATNLNLREAIDSAMKGDQP